MYVDNDEIYEKRQKYTTEIRNRQKQQIFNKIRINAIQQLKQAHKQQQQQKTSQQEHKTAIVQIQALISKLAYMYSISGRVTDIVDNMDHIVTFITQLRQYEDSPAVYTIKDHTQHNHHTQQHIIRMGASNMYQTNTIYVHDNNSRPILCPLLQYLRQLVRQIYGYFTMDIESGQCNQETYSQIQTKFNQILFPINYHIINLLALESQYQWIPVAYFEIILGIVNYRTFVDAYHNVFLSRGLPIVLKIEYFRQYLSILGNNPILCINNCWIFTKILLYAIQQQPNLITTQHPHPHRYPHLNSPAHNTQLKQVHGLLVGQIQRIYSILSFSDKLSLAHKNQYKNNANIILYKICNSMSNGQLIINSAYIMPQVERMMAQVYGLFNGSAKIGHDGDVGKGEYDISHIVSCLQLLQSMACYDNILSSIRQMYPTIWIYLLGIFQRISVCYWIQLKQTDKTQAQNNSNSNNNNNNNNITISNKYGGGGGQSMLNVKQIKKILPQIFFHPQFTVVLEKVLRCMANFVCQPALCQAFIGHQYSGGTAAHTKWIQTLTQIYNNNYKSQPNRLQCLYIFSNVLVVICRNHQQFNKDDKQEEDDNSNSNGNSILVILNESVDLILQVLKLSNKNSSIIISVLSTLRAIVEQYNSNRDHQQQQQHSRHSHHHHRQHSNSNSNGHSHAHTHVVGNEVLDNTMLLNRLSCMAQKIEEDDKENRRYQYYSEDVRLQALHLLQALRINH